MISCKSDNHVFKTRFKDSRLKVPKLFKKLEFFLKPYIDVLHVIDIFDYDLFRK